MPTTETSMGMKVKHKELYWWLNRESKENETYVSISSLNTTIRDKKEENRNSRGEREKEKNQHISKGVKTWKVNDNILTF